MSPLLATLPVVGPSLGIAAGLYFCFAGRQRVLAAVAAALSAGALVGFLLGATPMAVAAFAFSVVVFIEMASPTETPNDEEPPV